MATIKLIVRKLGDKIRVNSKGYTTIFVQYGHSGQTTLFSTELRIAPIHLKFDGSDLDQRNPIKKTLPGFTTKNSNIQKIVILIDQIKDRLINQDIIPTIIEVKRIYEESFKSKVIIQHDFFDLFENFIKDSRTFRSKNTTKQYVTCFNHLKNFEKHDKHKITFEKIDLTFYDKLQAYLVKEVGLANTSIGTNIKDLKAFLNYIKKRGVTISADVSEFKILRERPVIIYLTQGEVQTLYSMELESDIHEKSRDLFILQAQTGLRFSDLSRLGIEHLQGNILKLKAHKTKKDIKIPLTPIASAILNKYNFKLPEIAEQKQNKNIKELCKLAKMDTKMEIPKYKGGSKTYEVFYKWQLITTHVAVKTFITHCGEKGISPKTVSEITGKTVKVILEHYYGTSDNVIVEEMEKAFGITK
jgi:integrase